MTSLSIAQPSFHRVGGNLALDFANTISWRGTANETDHIATREGLARWAEEAGLLDEAIGRATLGEQCLPVAHALRLFSLGRAVCDLPPPVAVDHGVLGQGQMGGRRAKRNVGHEGIEPVAQGGLIGPPGHREV